MQIDFVITELNPGGAERCLTELAIGLKNRNHRIRILSLQSLPTGDKRVLVNRLDDNSVQIATADANRVWHVPRIVASMREFWQTRQPDIVQTFLHHANVLGSVMAKRQTSAAVVGGIRVAQPRRLRNRLERLAASRMDAVVSVSEAVARFARVQLGVDEERSHVIGNSVDVERFSRAKPYDWTKLEWPADAVVILFAGRMDAQKNLDAIFASADRWLNVAPTHRLLFLGDGPETSRVETFCDSVTDNRARHLDWTADVASVMSAARVLLLPSHYEGMPNVALEAMAAARPIVCSAVEGSTELFPAGKDRRRFQVYEPSDTETFTRLVQQFCEDPTLADRIGQLNQNHVQSHHAIGDMVDAYENLYRQLTMPPS